MIVIGVDPGVHTGIAVWDCTTRKLHHVKSMPALRAMEMVLYSSAFYVPALFVIVEDARKRKWFGAADERMTRGAGVREGVGSVKRDSALWEEFLTMHGIPHQMRAPRHTKHDAETFKKLTGWTAQTNQHSRDAALIVHGLNLPMALGLKQAYDQQRERERGGKPA